MAAIKFVCSFGLMLVLIFVSQLSFAAGDEKSQETEGTSNKNKMFFVVESHSLTGYEQASLKKDQSGQWTLVQNSNFLTNSFPDRRGIFKGPLSLSLEERFSKLVKSLGGRGN